MAGFHQFLSFLNRPSGTGTLDITLQSFDAATTSLITLSVTGMTATSPQTNAYVAWQQINTQLIQYGLAYTGSPVFTSSTLLDPNQPTFSNLLAQGNYRVHQSTHVLSFFSEAPFSLSVCSNTPGLMVVASNNPVLVTLDQAKAYAPLTQTDLSGFTDDQINKLMEIASARLVSVLNNNIVVCTYVHSEVGFMQRSIWLREGLPGLYYDGVRVKKPSQIYTFPILGTSLNWNYNKDTGELNWMLANNIVDLGEPTAMGNEIKVSYVAGNFSIPSDIVFGLVGYAQSILEATGNIASLKTGTWAVKFKASADDGLRSSLGGYQL